MRFLKSEIRKAVTLLAVCPHSAFLSPSRHLRTALPFVILSSLPWEMHALFTGWREGLLQLRARWDQSSPRPVLWTPPEKQTSGV